MGKRKKKQAADFRYDTGPARIPWAAVGEPIDHEDICDILSFLCPPAPHRQTKYDAQFQRVRRELGKLAALIVVPLSDPADKPFEVVCSNPSEVYPLAEAPCETGS